MPGSTDRILKVNRLFRLAAKNRASALHLHVGLAPLLTVLATTRELDMPALTQYDLEHLLLPILNDGERQRLQTGEAITFTYFVEKAIPFRLRLSSTSGALRLDAYRLVPGN